MFNRTVILTRNAFWCLLSCCKPLSGKRLQSLAVTVSQSNLALCVELGLICSSILSPKQNQHSRIDRQSNMWLHFMPFHHQKQAAAALEVPGFQCWRALSEMWAWQTYWPPSSTNLKLLTEGVKNEGHYLTVPISGGVIWGLAHQ